VTASHGTKPKDFYTASFLFVSADSGGRVGRPSQLADITMTYVNSS